jgi:hypothetical protein
VPEMAAAMAAASKFVPTRLICIREVPSKFYLCPRKRSQLIMIDHAWRNTYHSWSIGCIYFARALNRGQSARITAHLPSYP